MTPARTGPDAPPLPASFDWVAALVAVQAHVVALVTIRVNRGHFTDPAFAVVLALIALAVPMACIGWARLHRGELTRNAFVGACVLLAVVDVLATVGQRRGAVSTEAMWAAPAIGITLMVLSAYQPPNAILPAAAAHAVITGALVLWAAPSPGVDVFGAITVITAACFPAVIAAHYVRHFVISVRERQVAVMAEAASRGRAAAGLVIRQDAARRLQRLRSGTLPLLAAVAAGERSIDDPEVAREAQARSTDLRQELVEARAGSWLLEGRPAIDAAQTGAVLLDPQQLVRHMADHDLTTLSAVLAQLRRTESWARLSVALSPSYRAQEHSAFLTVVGQTRPDAEPLAQVDPAVAAVAERLGCSAVIESPGLLIVEGKVPLRDVPR